MSNRTTHSLTESSGPSLSMRCLPSFFFDTMMGGFRENVPIGRLNITEGQALLVSVGNGPPEPMTGRLTSLTNHTRSHVACSSAQGRPQPARMIFLEHTTPDLVQFKTISNRCGQEQILHLRQFLPRQETRSPAASCQCRLPLPAARPASDRVTRHDRA
jgi:hypothetical protein